MDKQKVIQSIERQIARQIAKLEDMKKLIETHAPESIPENVRMNAGAFGDILWAHFDYGDIAGIRDMRRQMGDKWEMEKSIFYAENGNRQITFRFRDDEDIAFIFAIGSPINGQSCELVKVGERIVNQYEIRCA